MLILKNLHVITIFATSLVHKLLTTANAEVTRENLYNFIVFKGCLHYKTITSQNVLSEIQVKNFSFCRKVMLRSQDIQGFAFLTIPWFTKSVISWWVLWHHDEYCTWDRVDFCVHPLNQNLVQILVQNLVQVTKLGQLINISEGNYFQESSKQFEGLGLSFNKATCSNYSIMNYVKISLFYFFRRWLEDN